MEYKLCKDNGNMIRCDFDCRKCANLVYEALTSENNNLRTDRDRFQSLFQIKSKDNAELIDKCQELEKNNAWLEKECDELRMMNDELRMMNDELRTMNSDLLYRNGLLMETTGPAVFQKVYIYDELNDKIEGLKEDIIRLDKCLSKCQCVQLERIKEERDGE